MNSDKPEVRAKKSKAWIWPLLLVIAGGASYLLYPRITQSAAKSDTKKSGKGSDASRPVPVVAALARNGDMPVYLTGLGSVTAFNTVTVKTRVDGQIVKIYFTEGQFVKEGEPLVDIDPRPYQVQLEQAEAQLGRDESQLANANLDLARYKALLAQDAVPKQQFDTQQALVNQVGGAIKSDIAMINAAKLQLVYAHILSPISGRIGLRLVDQGNIVKATDATGLATITQLQPIAVIFNIEQSHLPQVMAKMRAGVTLPVYAMDKDQKAKLATGKLLTVDNQIDQTTGTLRFKAQFENEDLSLFPNQFVDARLLVDTKHNAVIAPAAAVQRSPQSTFVYVVKEDNTVDVRNITVGITEGDNVSVTDGLQAGERVVIDGIDKLQQGSKVNVRMAGPGSRG
jgi:membrane fusion protein, multidrug efflux system